LASSTSFKARPAASRPGVRREERQVVERDDVVALVPSVKTTSVATTRASDVARSSVSDVSVPPVETTSSTTATPRPRRRGTSAPSMTRSCGLPVVIETTERETGPDHVRLVGLAHDDVREARPDADRVRQRHRLDLGRDEDLDAGRDAARQQLGRGLGEARVAEQVEERDGHGSDVDDGQLARLGTDVDGMGGHGFLR
jgi:hypothetical protein